MASLVLFPLCLKRDISAFRYAALLSIGALLYTTVVLTIQLPSYYEHYSTISKMTPMYFDFNIFTGCAMCFYAYTCQIQMLPIYSELVNPHYPRMAKVINRAMGIDCFFYLTIAIVGFMSELEDTAQLVLERDVLPGAGTNYTLIIAVL